MGSWSVFPQTYKAMCNDQECQGYQAQDGEYGGWYIDYLTQAEAIAAWNRRAPPCPWQPMETAPKDGRKVDLWYPVAGLSRIVDCWWSGDDDPQMPNVWLNMTEEGENGTYPNATPTHWMPRPLAPQAARAAGVSHDTEEVK